MRITWIILLVVAFSSCTTVYFQETQPLGVDQLNSFPEEMLGSYKIDLLDTLVIEKERYYHPEVHQNSYSLAQVDSNPDLEIRGDSFFDGNIPIKTGLPFVTKNDSIHYKKRILKYTPLSDSLVIKPFKQYLVVNARDNSKEYWTCFILEAKGNDLIMYMIGDLKTQNDSTNLDSLALSLDYFENITHFEKIGENKYLINPSKSDFKKLIDEGFFSAPLEMKRIE